MSWPVLPLGLLGSQASASAAPADNDTYQVSRSLRFNVFDSTYLSRTPASSGNRKTWTFSAWVKRSTIGSAQANYILGSAQAPSGTNGVYLGFGSDTLFFGDYATSGWDWYLQSSSLYRDMSAWYHVVAQYDTTQATASERAKLYVNGVRLTAFDGASTYPGPSADSRFNQASVEMAIGRLGTYNGNYFNGYMAEVNFIDGQALTPSSFGETDATTGRWKAKAFTGTYGVNGFYLPFLDNSGATSTTLGKDNSTYRMLTAQLNGTSNGIQRGADLTGIANGKAGTISLWANFTNSAGSYNPLWVSRNNSTIGDSVQLSRQVGGGLRLAALNSAGTGILNVSTAGAACSSSGLYHIYATWDLSVNNRVFIYVNGIDSTGTISTFTNDTIQYSVPNHGLGGNLFSPFVPTTPAMLGQVYVNYSTYLDPVTNISKFYSGSSTPVSLGTSGEIPSGSSPIVYLDGDATTILTNRGTGGNFAAHGTLATGTTYQGVGVHYNNWTPNNLSVTPGTGNDSLTDSPSNYGAISTTLVNDTYQISKSLRFNSADSAYLSRYPASASNRTTWTWSGWVKKCKNGAVQQIFNRSDNASNYTYLYFLNDDTIQFLDSQTGSAGSTSYLTTTAVFRDPAAWYHIVFVLDTTQLTNTNRMKLYVNGVQLTTYNSISWPNQNNQLQINTANSHNIGGFASASQYLDGYLTEVNFIDGQALTPTSFGTRDINTYLWKPKAYTGTYGTNGFYLPFLNTSTGSNSVLFSEDFSAAMYTKDASSVTTNTTTAPNGATTADTFTENSATTFHRFYFNNLTYTNGVTFTSSVYVKANTRSAVALENWNGAAANYCYADLSNGTVISGSHVSAAISSVGNGWYRISVSNVGTAGGVACGSALYIMNNAIAGSLSYTGNGSGSVFVWGMQTEASSVAGPYLWTNGFANSPTLLIGADASVATGGYNTWYPNNLSVTPGTGNDSLVDSPTYYGTDTGVGGEARGDYCTLNPLGAVAVTSTTNGNLDVSLSASGSANIRSTIAVSSGKWYWEVLFGSTGDTLIVGACDATVSNASSLWSTANAWMYYSINGQKYNGSGTSYGATFTNGDLIGIALDMDNGTISFYKNGVSQGQAYSGLIGRTLTPTIQSTARALTATANFGQRPFAYAAPSGFKALRDYNKLPVPTGGEVRGNYATLNPLSTVKGTLLDGNLRTNGGDRGSIATIGMSSGKWYCEMSVISIGSESSIGLSKGLNAMNTYVGSSADSWGYYFNGLKYSNGSSASYGSPYTTSDTIGAAFDADAGTLTFYKNGISQGVAYSSLNAGPYFFAASGRSSGAANDVALNFGQRPWAYDAPFGFLPICTTLLPQPIVQKSSTAMDVVTYTGNGGTQTISSLGFSPDFVWIKGRSDSLYWHILSDTVRGANKVLGSQITSAEIPTLSSVNSFSSNGFSLGADPDANANSGWNRNLSTYVAWAWDAGSSSVTNTSGAISSTVRANPQAGVSVVSYTGTGANATVGHGLGVAPRLVIVKNRSAVDGWAVYHANQNASPASGYTALNETSAFASTIASWNNTTPTSSVISVGVSSRTNGNGNNHIAYCFAEIEGFSKFGSYTGNGSADGPFVYCGFRPRWVMIKNATGTSNANTGWFIFDSLRNTFNTVSNPLRADSSDLEASSYAIDFLGNGFKLRLSDIGINNSTGATHIFAAFAESPFKYSRAR